MGARLAAVLGGGREDQSPDISILSDEFLADLQQMERKNLALEALHELLNAKLRVIAYELLKSLRESASVDWAHREAARARMRVLVKRILRNYGYSVSVPATHLSSRR